MSLYNLIPYKKPSTWAGLKVDEILGEKMLSLPADEKGALGQDLTKAGNKYEKLYI